jgi:hypothetical protein
MSDEEYKKFLTALAAKHISRRGLGGPEELERLHDKMKDLMRLSREVQDLQDEPIGKRVRDRGVPPKPRDLLHELMQTPIFDGFNAMEQIGILEALDDATDAVFANLRRSAIPDEDVQFLYRAGIADPELEITIAIEYARRRIRPARLGLARELREFKDIHREAADRLEKVLSDSSKDREAQPKKRKILNGIGKILGGAIAGAGNVLLLCGTIVAPNPATGYGAIASSAIAVAGVFQGAGDLRGE